MHEIAGVDIDEVGGLRLRRGAFAPFQRPVDEGGLETFLCRRLQVEKRLGSLSRRLGDSVAADVINTDLAGESAAEATTTLPDRVPVRTSWFEIDDIFFEARGTAWALVHFFRAAELDFAQVLADKNAATSVRQIIRELEASLQPLRSPIVLNGGGFGIFANHSLVMANYLARANAAVINLRELLDQG